MHFKLIKCVLGKYIHSSPDHKSNCKIGVKTLLSSKTFFTVSTQLIILAEYKEYAFLNREKLLRKKLERFLYKFFGFENI